MGHFLGSKRDPAGAGFSFQLCFNSDSCGRGLAGFPVAGEGSGGITLAYHCAGQPQPPCQGWAELPGAKLGVSCRRWQGIWGLVPGAITALLLDSRHSHKPDHLENYNKTCIDTRRKGLNTGDKGQKTSQASREASFYRAAAVPSLPLQLSYIDGPQRCWSPSHWCSCISNFLPGKSDWKKVSYVTLY